VETKPELRGVDVDLQPSDQYHVHGNRDAAACEPYGLHVVVMTAQCLQPAKLDDVYQCWTTSTGNRSSQIIFGVYDSS